jgi:hypothetical protein
MARKSLNDVHSDFYTSWDEAMGKQSLRVESGVLYQLRFFGDVQVLNYHSAPMVKKTGALTFFPLPCIGTHWVTEEPLDECPLCALGLQPQNSIVPQFININQLLARKTPVVQVTRLSSFVVDRMKTQFSEEYPDVEAGFLDSAKGCMFKVRYREGGKPTERWSITHSTVVPVRLIEDGTKVQVKVPSKLSDDPKLSGKVFTFETIDLDAIVYQPKRQELARKIEVLRVEEAMKRLEKKKRSQSGDDGIDDDDDRRGRRRRRDDDEDLGSRRRRDDDDDDDDRGSRRARADGGNGRSRRASDDEDFAPEEGLFDDVEGKGKGKGRSRGADDDDDLNF